MRKRAAGRPFAGQVQLTGRRQRAARAGPGAVGIAALQGRRRAGRSAGQPRRHGADVDGELRRGAGRHKPGDRVPLRFVRRSGETVNATLVLDEDPRIEIVPIEKIGGMLTDDQKRFRESWLKLTAKALASLSRCLLWPCPSRSLGDGGAGDPERSAHLDRRAEGVDGAEGRARDRRARSGVVREGPHSRMRSTSTTRRC